MENAADSQDRSHEFACPVRNLCQITLQPAFHLVEQAFQYLRSSVIQTDRFLLIVTGENGFDQIPVSGFRTLRDWLCGKGAPAHGGLRHGVQESGGKATTTKGVVAHQTVQHLGLYRQYHGKRRMNNALTGSAHTVDPDGIAAVPLEEDINVHIAVVQTAP